jgi:hypothetical protein
LKKLGFSLEEIHNMDTQTAEFYLDEFADMAQRKPEPNKSEFSAKVYKKKVATK